MPIFCLYVGSAYIPGWFPNLPIVTQSCVFSQSRQIHPGQPASHVMLPLSRVTCHVSCENCDSSNSSDSCGMLPVCASHIITRCSDHWNAMCAAAWKSRRQWNRSVCIRIGWISFNDRSGPWPWHYNLLSPRCYQLLSSSFQALWSTNESWKMYGPYIVWGMM